MNIDKKGGWHIDGVDTEQRLGFIARGFDYRDDRRGDARSDWFFPHSTTNIWLWALNTRSNGDVWFNTDDLAITGAILETGVLVLTILIMMLLTVNVKKGTIVKGMNGLMIACIIMLVVPPVGYIIGAEAYDTGFWMDHVAGFGIYGPFIAAGLLFVAFFIMKKN